VSGGRLLGGGWRPVFVAALAVAASALGWGGARPVRRVASAIASRGAGWLVGMVALLVGATMVTNALVLPRLYPAMHLGLGVLGLWVAALAALAWPERRESPRAPSRPRGPAASGSLGRRGSAPIRVALAVALLGASAAAAPWGARRLSTRDNLRFVLLERAPTLSHAVELGAWLVPPPPLDAVDVGPARSTGKRSVDLSGRDLLLVTIDALRADHVGAWGYGRPVTPNIDRLAREAVVFDYAYSPTPHTSYAIGSLMTGKYLRPLAQQGVPTDSETWAMAMRRYGYRTAAFFPPAAFYIDPEYFQQMQASGLDFEYRKVEFASAALRVRQVSDYLAREPAEQPLFLWVHLFEPHEPYERHPGHDFGDRNVDRYDSEIAVADEGLGAIVEAMRRIRPRTVVIVAADHGEEFGEHGGSYHGTTVYDEQVRVPLLVHAPGLLPARRVAVPVSLVDLVPTVLVGLGVPLTPRIHGRDLGPLLVGERPDDGFALAETDDQTLLAEGTSRLICARRVGACRLFDVARDPGELQDLSATERDRSDALRRRQAGFLAGLGRFEAGGAAADSPRAQWPPALRRAMAGDGDAATDVAPLLDDADTSVRRKAAEVLFELRRPETAAQLRRAVAREEDDITRRWCALGLTRLGQGAPLAYDLLNGSELEWQRLAALSLAEAGDDRGERVLVAWWEQAFPEDVEPELLGRALPFQRRSTWAAPRARPRALAPPRR
jgi:arylsulfatase A-like enzyme